MLLKKGGGKVKRFFSILITIFIFITGFFPAKSVKAASIATIIYPKYLPSDCSTGTNTPGDGTPFAVYVEINGYRANTVYAIKTRIGPYTSSLGYAISWKNEFNNSWANDSTPWSNLLKIKTDTSGAWSGWLVAKVQKTVPFGVLLLRMRMRSEPYDGGNIDSFPVAVNSLNMATQGGWIEGHAYINGIAVAGKLVVVKDESSNIVGTYLTENNTVDEGYDSSDAGYFKLGVPAGSGYSLELWDPLTNDCYSPIVNDVMVMVGSNTSVNINAVTNRAPDLDWTGENNYVSDGVSPDMGCCSTFFTYRVKYIDIDDEEPQTGYPIVHILKDNSDIAGSPFSMSEVDGVDTTYTDGKLYTYSTILEPGDYSYYFEAMDSRGTSASGSPACLKNGPFVSCILTASAEVGGSIFPSGCVILDMGSNQKFSINPNTGYHIVNVFVDGLPVGAIDSYLFNNITSDHTISATFAINTFTINTIAGGDGFIAPSGDITVYYGGSQSFTITPEMGCVISGILVDGSPVHIDNPMGETYTFSNVTADHTIVVSFDEETMAEIYTVKVAVAAYGGYAQVTPAEQSVQEGSPASILINPAVGYHITGLTDNGKSIGLSSIIANVNGTFTYSIPLVYEDHNILVTFEKYKYTINAEVGQGGTITPSGNVSVNYGENQSFTITPDEGYMISQILVDGTALTSTDNTYAFNNVTGNHTISATFNALNVVNSIMITLQIDNPYITVNGISTKIDAQGSKSVIKEGRTLIPIRTIIESLGGAVEWNATERKVTTTLSGHSIVLWIDNNMALVDGNKIMIDPDNSKVTPVIINGRTYLSLRFIAEKLGASVNWNAETQTVTIYY